MRRTTQTKITTTTMMIESLTVAGLAVLAYMIYEYLNATTIEDDEVEED